MFSLHEEAWHGEWFMLFLLNTAVTITSSFASMLCKYKNICQTELIPWRHWLNSELTDTNSLV
jgi:hypothetical protein